MGAIWEKRGHMKMAGSQDTPRGGLANENSQGNEERTFKDKHVSRGLKVLENM